MTTTLRLALVLAGTSGRRSFYLAVTVALAVAGWLGLAALAAPFAPGDIPFAGQSLVKSLQPAGMLPLRYVERIAALPGVDTLYYQNFNPVICKPPHTAATLNGYGGPGVSRALAELSTHIPVSVVEQWRADSVGILVGSKLAKHCDWAKGMSVQPRDVAGQRMSLHIIGVFESDTPGANQMAIAHFGYINRMPHLMRARDHVVAITAYAHDPQSGGRVAARIESEFAHDDPPVQALTSSTAAVGMARYGNIRGLVFWVMLALFVTTAMVLISALAHAVAERRSTMATLQVLGFRRRALFASFLVESIVIVLLGLAGGMALGLAVIAQLAPSIAPVLAQFAVPGWAYVWLPAWLGSLLLLSVVLPMMIIRHTRPVDYPVT